MVTRGQLLERPVVLPTSVGCLDGIFLRGGGPGLLVASPLPGHGGSMTTPIGSELAYAAAYAGHASLRLDYRGVGASEGEESQDPRHAGEDLRHGVDFLCESTGVESVVLASALSGAWPALLAAQADPRVTRLLLVSPPFGAPPAGVPSYGEVGRRILVVAGADDPTFEHGAELERVEAASNVRLEVVPGASRSFREALLALARLVPQVLGAGRRDPDAPLASSSGS